MRSFVCGQRLRDRLSKRKGVAHPWDKRRCGPLQVHVGKFLPGAASVVPRGCATHNGEQTTSRERDSLVTATALEPLIYYAMFPAYGQQKFGDDSQVIACRGRVVTSR